MRIQGVLIEINEQRPYKTQITSVKMMKCHSSNANEKIGKYKLTTICDKNPNKMYLFL